MASKSRSAGQIDLVKYAKRAMPTLSDFNQNTVPLFPYFSVIDGHDFWIASHLGFSNDLKVFRFVDHRCSAACHLLYSLHFIHFCSPFSFRLLCQCRAPYCSRPRFSESQLRPCISRCLFRALLVEVQQSQYCGP
jgi:hypothetical protein